MPQLPLTKSLDKALNVLVANAATLRPEGDFMVRTTEGLQALVAALISMPKEQERLTAVVLSDVSFYTRLLPFGPRLNLMAEPAMFLLLAANAIAHAGEITPGHYVSLDEYEQEQSNDLTAGHNTAPTAVPQTLESASLWLTTIALGSAALARVAKNRAEQSGRLRTPQRWGVRAVIIQNLCYSGAALAAGARPKGKALGVYASLWAVGTCAALIAAKRNKAFRGLVPAVALGGAASATTAALMSDESVFRSGSIAARGVSHGANLLLAAESLTFMRALVEGTGKSKRSKPHRIRRALNAVLGATESVSSFTGNLLLADGLNRS